jgi:uncharacterized protein YbaR (Trm112 family)
VGAGVVYNTTGVLLVRLVRFNLPAMDEKTAESSYSVDPRLLEVLVCPLTKKPLRYDRERQELVSEAAKLAYPIRDGVPVMLPDEARKLDG